MNINLYIIEKELKRYFIVQQKNFISKPDVLNCKYMEWIDSSQEVFKEPVLYIGKSKDLPKNPVFHGSPSFLLLGDCPGILYQKNANLLLFSADLSLNSLANHVQKIFNNYLEWQEQMQRVIDENKAIRELGILGYSKLGNPFILQGPGFRAIFQILPSPAVNSSPLFQSYYSNYQIEDNSYMNLADIAMLSIDPDYQEAENSSGAQLIEGELYGFRSIYININIHNLHVARICLDEIQKPFEESDYAALTILAEYVRKKLQRDPSENFQRPSFLDEILESLLRHVFLPEPRIVKVLNSLHWEQTDTYLCLLLNPQVYHTDSELVPIAYNLLLNLTGCCHQILDGAIVLIVNLTRSLSSQDILLKHCVNYIRDNMLKMGISMTFHDFKELYYYYHQAQEALRYGELQFPHLWYYHYEDFFLKSLIYRAKTGQTQSALLPDGLKRLQIHDQTKNSRYVETLCIYLRNERNIAETARATFQHRNTLLYQLTQIRKILNMDLDKPEVRLLLLMIFQILEYNQKETDS